MIQNKGFVPPHLGDPLIKSQEPERKVFSPEELARMKEETDIAIQHGHPPGKRAKK